METLLQRLAMSTCWQGESTTQPHPGKGQRSFTAAAVSLGWYSFGDQLGEEGFQEECSLSDETSIPFYCKQWTLLKAHLRFSNTFCTWIFVFLPEAQLFGMHEECPSASQTVMGADSVSLSENQRLSDFPYWNKTSVLWTFSGKFRKWNI